MMMSCVGFEVYKFSKPPLLAQQFFQSPPLGCLKIFGALPQYLHPSPLVILNELSLRRSIISTTINIKGAVSRQSSSFCLILPITRPQSLWNLK